MKSILFAAAATMALAAPAAAQSAASWTGFYVGGRVGYVATPLKTNQSVLFDKNLDGSFGDTVTTAAGANAFSPGFCNGVATARGPPTIAAPTATGSTMASMPVPTTSSVVSSSAGRRIWQGQSRGQRLAFSTTPANYVLTRELRGTFGARARVGYDIQGTMPYLTAGIVRAKVRSSFSTTNTANAFATRGEKDNANGYRLGGGFETRLGPISLGALYLFTNVKDDGFRVDVTRGTAPRPTRSS